MNGTSQIPGPWTDPYHFTQKFTNPIVADKVKVTTETPGSVEVVLTDFIPKVLWRPGLVVSLKCFASSDEQYLPGCLINCDLNQFF